MVSDDVAQIYLLKVAVMDIELLDGLRPGHVVVDDDIDVGSYMMLIRHLNHV
jgi:hypothetical protein